LPGDLTVRDVLVKGLNELIELLVLLLGRRWIWRDEQ
jgi:hypothetical protein